MSRRMQEEVRAELHVKIDGNGGSYPLVPTLCVGTHDQQRFASSDSMQGVEEPEVPTQSVGTSAQPP